MGPRGAAHQTRIMDDPPYDGIVVKKMSGTDVADGFECAKPEFAEHLRATAPHHQRELIGQPYLFMRGGEILGYVVLAASRLGAKDRQSAGAHGIVPAVLITYMATHKRHERRGIGRLMVSWSVSQAKAISRGMGCRLVTVNAEPDVSEFYAKLGFVRASEQEDGCVAMYLDIAD